MNLRLSKELKARLTKIAQVNGISVADVVRLCLAQGISKIESGQILPAKSKAELGFELPNYHEEAA